MNIHEYQGHELFRKFGVPVPASVAVTTSAEAEKAAASLEGERFVVKAQIHAGGRGKGTFANGFQGGVHLVSSPAEAGEMAARMLGETLVTHQTGPEGKQVNTILVGEAVDIDREFYFAVLMDRDGECPVIVASPEGGMDIEAVAEETPEKIFREFIDPTAGELSTEQAAKLAADLGFSESETAGAIELFQKVFKLWYDCDCSMVEINPLVVTRDGGVMALDAKFGFDGNALFRHPDIAALRDESEEDPREVEASRYDLNYIGLDGNIACMVNGAGLAMSTMDIIKHYGGDPANFLDVGGGADETQVENAFRILVSDPNVEAILVNIFGGIMKCDVIAQGILNAAKNLSLEVPLVVRLEGTNVAEGKELLENSGLAIITASDLGDAAQKAVAAAKDAA